MAKFIPSKAYASGLLGSRENPRSDEVFNDYIIRSGGDPDGGRVRRYWELTGAGADKLTLLFPVVQQVFPGAWPGPAQLWGDCVGKGTANAVLATLAVEIANAKPDQETGKIETAPELTKDGIKNSVISSESIFAWRGYDGDGWVGSEAAQAVVSKGFLVRKEYPELGLDLTRYTESTIHIGGSRKPDAKFAAEAAKHRPRTSTVLKGREQVRDFLAAGYGVMNCSSLGFENVRDENGVSRQIGKWQHCQSFIAYDDRPATRKRYGQALVLWLNQWGNNWNSGPRRIMGTDIDIPPGSYWGLASTIDECRCFGFSSVAGWPRNKVPTYGARGRL